MVEIKRITIYFAGYTTTAAVNLYLYYLCTAFRYKIRVCAPFYIGRYHAKEI